MATEIIETRGESLKAEAKPAISLRPRLWNGLFWNSVATVFFQLSTFASNIVVANLLGKTLFGEYSIIQSTLNTLATVGTLASGITAARYISEFRTSNKEKAGNILGGCIALSALTGSAVAFLLIPGRYWIAEGLLNASHLASALLIMAGAVLFTVMNAPMAGALSGLEGYKSLALVRFTGGVINLATGVIGVWKGGVTGGVVALSISAFVQWLVFSVFIRREMRAQGIGIRWRNAWQERKILFGFALPTAISGILTMPSVWLAGTILVHQNQGHAQMALFAAANNLRIAMIMIPNIAGTVSASLMNNQRGVGDLVRYRKVFRANFLATVSVVIAGALVAALLGNRWLQLFGRDYHEAYPSLLLLLLAAVAETASIGLYQIIQSQERMWASLFCLVIPRELCLLVLAWQLVPLYGAKGLASAYAGAMLLSLILHTILASRVAKRVLKTDSTAGLSEILCAREQEII